MIGRSEKRSRSSNPRIVPVMRNTPRVNSRQFRFQHQNNRIGIQYDRRQSNSRPIALPQPLQAQRSAWRNAAGSKVQVRVERRDGAAEAQHSGCCFSSSRMPPLLLGVALFANRSPRALADSASI